MGDRTTVNQQKTVWEFEGGSWRLDDTGLDLYLGEDQWVYDIALDRCETPAEALGWIYQIYDKSFVTEGCMHALLGALRSMMDRRELAQQVA